MLGQLVASMGLQVRRQYLQDYAPNERTCLMAWGDGFGVVVPTPMECSWHTQVLDG